jgi:hypothetical protein
MSEPVTLETVLALAHQLTPLDKLRLIALLAPQLERAVASAPLAPRKSLRGLWRGLDITDDDIDQARREMWVAFPREDI